jgi:hypothetical protein
LARPGAAVLMMEAESFEPGPILLRRQGCGGECSESGHVKLPVGGQLGPG